MPYRKFYRSNTILVMGSDYYKGQFSINAEKTSPYWMVSFIGPDGKMKRRSTKVPVDGGIFEGEKLSKAQAKKRAAMVGLAIAQSVAAEFEAHDNVSVRTACRDYLAALNGRMVSVQTKENAGGSVRCFLRWLGAGADSPARLITRARAREFVDWRRSQVRCKTVRKDLSAISGVWARLLDMEVVSKNPFAGLHVSPDTKAEKVVHEAFTLEEINLLIEKLPDEWSSAVRCSYELFGQRLGDVLGLRWDAFDWEAGVVRIVTGKTGRVLVQAVSWDFMEWAKKRMETVGGEWVHPRLRMHSNPSPEFTGLVRLHGIGLMGTPGVGNRRVWHSKTFHSIRATVATLLQAGGVSQGMAMELVGHDSAAVHAAYIRPDVELRRQAGGLLPRPRA